MESLSKKDHFLTNDKLLEFSWTSQMEFSYIFTVVWSWRLENWRVTDLENTVMALLMKCHIPDGEKRALYPCLCLYVTVAKSVKDLKPKEKR